MTNLVILPISREVVFVGCDHRAILSAVIVVPAFNNDRMLYCASCSFMQRQWRYLDEEPSVAHGSSFDPVVFDTPRGGS